MNPMNPALPKTSHVPTTDPYAADRDLPPGRPENTGDYKKALAYQDRLFPLHEAIFLEPGLAGAKYGLSLLGKCSEDVRLPLVTLTDGTKARIKAAMQHAGLI